VVEAARAPFPIRYAVQPKKNIALTRNHAVRLATGAWIGFLDDDEMPPVDWLRRMYTTVTDARADAVLGPVISELPLGAPEWIRTGDFFSRRRFLTGTVVPRQEYRIGNALVSAAILRRIEGPFDPDYGLSGGEDGRMLNLLANVGARIVWCDEAAVVEPIESGRLSRQWLLRRAYRGGQDFARHTRSGAYGPVRSYTMPALALRATVQLLTSGILAGLAWPFGEARRIRWLRKAHANAGKLAVLTNRFYEEYR
jgi:succinoglycan biosynthesis protein ExoM